MKLSRIINFVSIAVIIVSFLKIVFHLNFVIFPVVFFLIGLVSSLINQRFSLVLFVFLFPFINSTSSLLFNGYPFNYMAPSLFLLSGIVIGNSVRRNDPFDQNVEKNFYFYNSFLLILLTSFVFVFLRWSNITLSGNAFGVDSPVSPLKQRISFATIFPVVSLFIFFISPYIYFYLKKINFEKDKIFIYLSYGYFISVIFALFQKIFKSSLLSMDRWVSEFNQHNGGGSDFNSFGFFSGVMFLWSTYEIKEKNFFGFLTFLFSLAGVILSGSRAAFFFIIAGIFNLILQKRIRRQKILLILLIAIVMVSLIFLGGKLKERLVEQNLKGDNLIETVNKLSNGRVWMSIFSFKTIKENFISGIGTGNFVFYLDYKNFQKKYIYDLTLNQYLLIFTETGIFGFVFFAIFLFYIFKYSKRKLLLGTILLALLFNNFFWFPEAIILFWILISINFSKTKEKEKNSFLHKKIILSASILIFIFSNIVSFNSIHPKKWAKEAGAEYDYGFWFNEKNPEGKEFCWTKKKSGVYIYLNTHGESEKIMLFCGAPLNRMEEKQQKVDILWKGKLFREVTFKENKEYVFKIKGDPLDEGFLEFRVFPVFNLKKMNLSTETRDLGVQVFLGKISEKDEL